MGVGVSARLQHTPGIRQWDPRTENWVPTCASIWDQNLPLIPSDSRPEMGGVWLGRVLINAQIAAGLLRSDRRQGHGDGPPGSPNRQ